MKRQATSTDDALQAIKAGRAYLRTFTGRHKVVAIRHGHDCNIVTNNTGSFVDQQGWAACVTDIEIDDAS